jgi:hypothetical protein
MIASSADISLKLYNKFKSERRLPRHRVIQLGSGNRGSSYTAIWTLC